VSSMLAFPGFPPGSVSVAAVISIVQVRGVVVALYADCGPVCSRTWTSELWDPAGPLPLPQGVVQPLSPLLGA
jgi:hypothetical protein